MGRRKSKKLKRQKTSTDSEIYAAVFAASIEEDLRQQRLRQKAREQSALLKQGGPSADGEPDNSLPVSSVPARRQDIILRGLATSTSSDLVRLPALSFTFLQNESPLLSVHQKSKIRNLWHSKHILENMIVNPRASVLYGKKRKWRTHELPDGMNAPFDLTCKSYLHASARTFDVATLEENRLPAIGTAFQGGFGVFSATLGRPNQFHSMRGLPVYSVRMHKRSNRCGTVVVSNDRYSLYRFQCYPLRSPSSFFEVGLQEPVSDFAFGTDLILFACPRYFGRSVLSPIFLTLEDGREGLLRSLNVQNFPQSDALRVEMACEKEKYVAFGHRNGQVSLLDLRQPSMCSSIVQYMGESTSQSLPVLGSATDMKFVSNQHQLLVKRSFGSTQLHDLRQVSSSKNNSVVYNYTVPSDILPTASATCNGLVVDPTCQQTLMTPYINTNHDACLGFWSMKSGTFVGNTVLAKNGGDAGEKDTLFVEMCQTTTAAFVPKSLDKRTQQHESDPSRFGVWLKCGRFSKQSLGHGKAGSLQHLSFPGSLSSCY